MNTKQHEQSEAMKRIERRAKPEHVRYVGNKGDLLAAGIIGEHMVPERTDATLYFRYGRTWNGELCVGGVCSVMSMEGKLAVYWWAKRGDGTPNLDSARPNWQIEQAKVMQLPLAAATKARVDAVQVSDQAWGHARPDEVTAVGALRVLRTRYRNSERFTVIGPQDELLSRGMIDADWIPLSPKRLYSQWFDGNELVRVRRTRGGVLELNHWSPIGNKKAAYDRCFALLRASRGVLRLVWSAPATEA